MIYDKPLPQPNADTKPFWDACREHRLVFQQCLNCEYIRWPASSICPKCHIQDAKWVEAGGKGKIYSFVVFHIAYHDAFKNELPYINAVIELDEGPHLLSRIVNCNIEDVRCDMRVKVVWTDIADNFSLPFFEPEVPQIT